MPSPLLLEDPLRADSSLRCLAYATEATICSCSVCCISYAKSAAGLAACNCLAPNTAALYAALIPVAALHAAMAQHAAQCWIAYATVAATTVPFLYLRLGCVAVNSLREAHGEDSLTNGITTHSSLPKQCHFYKRSSVDDTMALGSEGLP